MDWLFWIGPIVVLFGLSFTLSSVQPLLDYGKLHLDAVDFIAIGILVIGFYLLTTHQISGERLLEILGGIVIGEAARKKSKKSSK